MAYESLHRMAYEYSENFIDGLEYGKYSAGHGLDTNDNLWSNLPHAVKTSAAFFYIEPIIDIERQAERAFDGQIDTSGGHRQMTAVDREEAAWHLGVLVGYFEAK